jgi:ABC-type transporter Mla MlaB component
MGSSRNPDAATVEALARLALQAKRRGLRLRLQHAPAELVELIEFMGLAKALGLKPRR